MTPGSYALRVHHLIEEQFIDHMRDQVGVEDYTYYESKSAGIAWGCLLFAIATLCLITKKWLVSVGIFILWAVFVYLKARGQGSDNRFQKIAKRIAAFDEQYPPYIYVLRKVADTTGLKGGWHDLP